jgi:hypothetical protein
MYKKQPKKKVTLNRETLRQLSMDHLEAVVGGATNVRTICFSCYSVCRTNCHGC